MPVTMIHLVLMGAVLSGDPPQAQDPPTEKQLAAITERGRLLAGYDSAAWHASDAVQELNPRPGSIVRYIARKTETGWVVAFGKLNDKQDTFLIACEARSGEDPEVFGAKEFDPPKEDTGFYRSAALALGTAEQDFVEHFEGKPRPYNVAVLPAERDEFWVYFVPAPTKPGIWPLGGDVRYRIAADGATVIEKRQLHKAIIEKQAPQVEDDAQAVAGMHTHVLDNTPEDTDVFHVLSRTPNVPELIATEKFVFVVEKDGAIQYLGTVEEVLKK